jgi:FkbM family methyltransferase
MLKKYICKFIQKIIKIILPLMSYIFINLRVNKRVINYLNLKSFSGNNKYNFSKIINDLNGHEKIIALDVGAQGGFNSDKFFSPKYNHFFEPIMVEPIKEEFEKLKKTYQFIIDKGLWSSKTKKKLYILANRLGSSSMYEPDKSSFNLYKIKKKNFVNFEITNTIEIDCETMDEALKKINISKLDYLKLDTQGAELEILKGMKNYNPLLIRTEVQIFSMYKNVPNWTNLMGLLSELNYMVCEWKEIGSHATRISAEMDMIFIPNYKTNSGKDLIIKNENKFISLMLIFGQLDLLKIILNELQLPSYEKIEKFKDRFFF